MLIITRYFCREFTRVLGLCLATFISLYLIVELFEKLRDIIAHQVPVALVLQFFVCGIPRLVYQLCPLAVLLSTCITIGLFVRNNEITALKAHGISLFRVLNVFILIAGVLFAINLVLQQYIMPLSTERFRELREVHIEGSPASKLVDTTEFWYRAQDGIYNIDFFEPENNLLKQITIVYLDDHFQIQRILYARTGHWNGEAWELRQGWERVFSPDGSQSVAKFDQKARSLWATPEDFHVSRKKSDELSFTQMRRLIEKIRTSGYPSTSYEVDLHAKASYAFINVIMAILGIPFALSIGRSGGMALGIAFSVCIGLIYWLFFSFCLSLGKSGVLHPFIAAWIANIVFGLLGVYLFLRVRQ